MKILHIAGDDKFIDHARDIFDLAYPDRNYVWVFSKSQDLKFVKGKCDRVVYAGLAQKRCPKIPTAEYKGYDLIVFHSLGELLYPEVFNIPNEIPIIWIGWGYDYYDLMCRKSDLFLPETRKIISRDYKARLRANFGKILRSTFDLTGISKSRQKAIEKISFFSPVLPNEYEILQNSREWRCFPEHVRWNYGTMEDHLVKGFESEQVDGDAILVGNSATPTCNHKEILDLLNKIGVGERYIIAPLSYGNQRYGDRIADVGVNYFGELFNPLREFMPAQDYVATIKKCGYVIMNHKRQQAVGNIVIMLYLGARVFLREESPTYSFFRDMGVTVSTVQELSRDNSLLSKPLSGEEKEKNRKLVFEYWSRSASVSRTKLLVENALKLSDQNRCGLGVVSDSP